MRKINSIVSVLFAVLVFISTYYAFNTEYNSYRSSFHLQSLIDEKEEDSYLVSVVLNSQNVGTREDLVDELMKFSDDHEFVTIIAFQNAIFEGTTVQTSYLYGPFANQMLSKVYFSEDMSDFDFNSRSSNKTVSNTILARNLYDEVYIVDSLDNTSKNIHLSSMQNYKGLHRFVNDSEGISDDSMSIYFVARKSDHAVGETLSLISNELSVVRLENVDFMQPELSVYDDSTRQHDSILSTLNRLITVVAVVMLMNSIILYFRRQNEVQIRKLLGNSDFRIFLKVFLTDFIMPMFVYVSLTLILCLFVVLPLRPISLEYLQSVFRFTGLFLIACIGVIVIMLVFSILQNRKSTLKNKNTISDFVQLNLIVKVLLLVVVLVPVATIAERFQSNLRYYQMQSALNKEFGNTAIIDGIGSESDSLETVNMTLKAVDRKLSKSGFKYIQHYAYNGTEIVNNMKQIVPLYIMQVNDNYFDSDVSLYDESNTLIDLSQLDNTVDYLFVHKSMSDSDYEQDTRYICRKCTVVYYSNTVNEKVDSFFDRYLEDTTGYGKNVYGSTFTNPIIFLARNSFKISGNSFTANYYRDFNESFTSNDFTELIESISTIADVDGTYASLALSDNFYSMRSNLLTYAFYISVVLVTIISMTLQNTYSFFVNQSKLIALKYLNGVSFLSRYLIVYLINAIIYIIVFLYASKTINTKLVYLNGSALTMLLILLVVDILMITVVFKTLEHTYLNRVLKGGE